LRRPIEQSCSPGKILTADYFWRKRGRSPSQQLRKPQARFTVDM
jgi:hypothetical protein